MANWNNPVNTTDYASVLALIKELATDAASLFVAAPSNQPTGSIRYNRSTNLFEEWSGAAWVVKTLAVAGGGTGSVTAAGARTNLGLGTMAVQNAATIAVTGGTLAGVTMSTTSHTGAFFVNGGPVSVTTVASNVSAHFASPNTAGVSFGVVISSGTNNGDYALFVRNATQAGMHFQIRGDGVTQAATALVIPVGANKWAT